jgi:hypothetical protein
MTCAEFTALIDRHWALPVAREVWDSPEGDAWQAHRLSCTAFLDRCLAHSLRRRGLDPEAQPCVHVAYYSTCDCEPFRTTGTCDNLSLRRDTATGTYAIISLDGDALGILFCPRCGVRLPR